MGKIKWNKTEQGYSYGPGVATSQDGILCIKIEAKNNTNTSNGKFRLYQRIKVHGDKTYNLFVCREHSLRAAKEEAEKWVAQWKYGLHNSIVLCDIEPDPCLEKKYPFLQSLDGRLRVFMEGFMHPRKVIWTYVLDGVCIQEREVEGLSLRSVYDCFFDRRPDYFDRRPDTWRGTLENRGRIRSDIYRIMCDAGMIDSTQSSEPRE